MKPEKGPIGSISTLAASAENIIGNLTLVMPRTITITARVKYNAAASQGLKVKLFFSPDGENYDTVAYTSFDVNFSAGAAVQETKIIDAPETGYLRISVQNLDTGQSATGIKVWTTIQEWGKKSS